MHDRYARSAKRGDRDCSRGLGCAAGMSQPDRITDRPPSHHASGPGALYNRPSMPMHRGCRRWVPLRPAVLLVALIGMIEGAADGIVVPPARAGAADAVDLTTAFARASEAIRRHQSPQGYWTTAVTPGPVFENPIPETNVFTPAVLIDLLDPVAGEAGLTDVVSRARGYLRSQIEH